MMARRVTLALAFVVTPISATAYAQTSANLVATASLTNTAPLTVANQDLDFGAVLPGFPVTLDPRNAATAGSFTITGAQGAEITIQFTLPGMLTAGPEIMGIAFGPTAGCQVGLFQFLRFACTNFDPSVTLTRRIPNSGAFNAVYVWVGGTVSPVPAQAAGNYRATITLTTAYTGN